jgi:hypothetical protein
MQVFVCESENATVITKRLPTLHRVWMQWGGINHLGDLGKLKTSGFTRMDDICVTSLVSCYRHCEKDVDTEPWIIDLWIDVATFADSVRQTEDKVEMRDRMTSGKILGESV